MYCFEVSMIILRRLTRYIDSDASSGTSMTISLFFTHAGHEILYVD